MLQPLDDLGELLLTASDRLTLSKRGADELVLEDILAELGPEFARSAVV